MQDDAEADAHPDLSAVGLFPLPNVVLFPRAVLPLHIFEERYKAMTADALVGQRRIAMALLRPGWEKNYYGRPQIEPVVCVGRILPGHERLPDGKYNFFLQGELRARIVKEHPPVDGRLYRVARLEPIPQTPVLDIDLDEHRQRLLEMFTDGPLSRACLAKQFRQMLTGVWPVSAVADLIAFHLLEDISLKQSLLAEPDTQSRVARTIHALNAAAPMLAAVAGSTSELNMN